jgi:cytidylate kinase
MASKNLLITVSREHGSGGRQIAQEVARKLKLAYVDSQIIRQATQQLGITAGELADFDERVEPQLDQITELVSRRRANEGRIAISEVLVPDRTPRDFSGVRSFTTLAETDPSLEKRAATHKGYHELVAALIREVAAKGRAVILGRGSQFVLKTRPHTLHIHICAPLEFRIQRLVALQHISSAEAEQAIRESDGQRENYTRRYYQADWRDPYHYHLVLNTAHLTLPVAVETVTQLAQNLPEVQPAEEVHSTYDRLAQESYSLKEAADLFWVSPDLLKQAAYRGDLKVSVVDHQIHRISRDALLEWLHKATG